jgi:hypothetical protein
MKNGARDIRCSLVGSLRSDILLGFASTLGRATAQGPLIERSLT